MPDVHVPAEREASGVVALLATRDHRLAMTLGPARPWEGAPGARLAPLALLWTAARPGDGLEAALALGSETLGLELEPVACRWTYGPSERRATDREPALGAGAPFLRYIRFDVGGEPAGDAPPAPPIRTPVAVYLARAGGEDRGADRGANGECSILWLPVSALRAALGGLWLSALLAMEGVSLARPALEPARLVSPDETLVFTPAIAGERQVLRACAKYGDEILFPAR